LQVAVELEQVDRGQPRVVVVHVRSSVQCVGLDAST
jgi:hypothetical protein